MVGDVALDAEDMHGAFAVLRKTATALEPGGVRTKVLLPNEQIKYLTIDTPDMDDAARRAAATIALDGATPYAVEDLAYDISVDGDQTHIAAVAKETLTEAEAFANDHRFHPVSFAAVPGDNTYLGEPFFGVTATAATLLENGEEVEPDGIAVVVIGDIETPKGPVADDAKTPDDVPVDVETLSETVPADEEEKPTEQATKDTAEATASAPAEPPSVPVTKEAEVASPQPAEESKETAQPTLGFASRRGGEKPAGPGLQGVTRDKQAPQPPAAVPPVELPKANVTAPKIDIEPEITAATQVADPVPPIAPAAPAAEPAPAKAGFLSRRKPKSPPAKRKATAATAAADAGSEEDRMTIFGARKTNVGGKPRFLGLILTAALLVFLAGVAAWASVFLDDGMALSRLFGDRAPKSAQIEPPKDAPAEEPQIQVASLDPTLTEEDTAVLDALREPVVPADPVAPSAAEVEAKYAATGIWTSSPVVPPEPAELVDIENLYLTSIDPVSTATDAIALPAISSFSTDVVLAAFSSPAAAGTQFALDDAGLVIPTALGALSPDGFTVILGKPPLVPPATPVRLEKEPEDTAIISALAAARPAPRPAGLVERTERAQLDGLTRRELSRLRPALRPVSLQQEAEAAAAPAPADPEPATIATAGAVALALATPPAIQNATKHAVKASVRPDLRPRNFSRIVKRAQRNAQKDEVRVASAAAVAPRVVTPKTPSKTSVAKQATVKNALNLRKINLIGVYGKPSSRRALVRLGNGRYKKVVVGDRIDGGQVSAIGEGELRYTKSGRNVVLKMPR